MAKLILENENGRYEIETKDVIDTLTDYYDYLIKPVLLAAGFAKIDEFFDGEE